MCNLIFRQMAPHIRPARHGRDLQGALQSAVQDIVSSVIDHVEATTSTAHSVRIDDSLSEREQDLPSDDFASKSSSLGRSCSLSDNESSILTEWAVEDESLCQTFFQFPHVDVAGLRRTVDVT